MGILRSIRSSFSTRAGGCVAAVLSLTLGCRKTVDSLGSNDTTDAAKRELQDLSGPTEYPNAFRDVLGKTSDQINLKITQAFNTLFHGNSDQAIFFPVGDDQACIKDVYHNGEVRTEGMGLGMIIAVELNKQFEFDQLWRYAKENLMIKSGSARGYFTSHCNLKSDGSVDSRVCLDPFGLQQFTMALVLANARWGTGNEDADAGAMDYNSDVWMLLDVMRYKVQQNGGVVDGITNTFDANTLLVFD
jgi:oligosaccharide reducing-end xylanase